ncbi:MAG TPA: hypothetical protein VMU27_03545 [Candidatus Paceibacterota bacterium]|nr:hypothetical protein [Candidatus Paceibacterota bacterium]
MKIYIPPHFVATLVASAAVSMFASAVFASSVTVATDSMPNLIPIYVTQADLSAGMLAPTSDDPTTVQSSADLSGYTAALLQDDINIGEIQASSGQVSVAYDEPTKILGIFATDIEAMASARSDGSVDVSYPWYAFSFAGDASDIRSKIQERVTKDFTGASAGFTASQQAVLIGDMAQVMQAEANSFTSATDQ